MKYLVLVTLSALALLSGCATQPTAAPTVQAAPEPAVAPLDLLVQQLDGLEAMGLKVERTDDSVHITMPGGMAFASGSSEIDAAAREPLDLIAMAMTAVSATRATIVGHTDSRGAENYNMLLSEDRADAVRAYIAGKGVDTVRLDASGMGETEPVADNDTAEGRAANRRVDILLSVD